MRLMREEEEEEEEERGLEYIPACLGEDFHRPLPWAWIFSESNMSSSTTKSLVTKQHHWTTITTVTSIAVSHTLSLRCFTNSFSASTKIGHGRLGSVHKATLTSGLSVALKFMDSSVSL